MGRAHDDHRIGGGEAGSSPAAVPLRGAAATYLRQHEALETALMERQRLEQEVRELRDRQVELMRSALSARAALLATVELLADTIEAADPYMRGHCRQVVRFARETARRLGLDDATVRTTCYAALLHDIGKVGVSAEILNKPGALLQEERALVQAHVRIGYDLLRTVPALEAVAVAVLHHHEWYDGAGYPHGLAGEAIPLPARIVAVADAYATMRDRRAYKDAQSGADARAELRRCAGTQFDPAVVDAMLEAIDALDGETDIGSEPCGPLPM